jgi:hypothetical protein
VFNYYFDSLPFSSLCFVGGMLFLCMKRRKKHFNWALYENLCKIERNEVFRLLKWAVDSLPPPWDSGWEGIGRKPYNAKALAVLTIWQKIKGKACP